jgi:hypothetical protein
MAVKTTGSAATRRGVALRRIQQGAQAQEFERQVALQRYESMMEAARQRREQEKAMLAEKAAMGGGIVGGFAKGYGATGNPWVGLGMAVLGGAQEANTRMDKGESFGGAVSRAYQKNLIGGRGGEYLTDLATSGSHGMFKAALTGDWKSKEGLMDIGSTFAGGTAGTFLREQQSGRKIFGKEDPAQHQEGFTSADMGNIVAGYGKQQAGASREARAAETDAGYDYDPMETGVERYSPEGRLRRHKRQQGEWLD